MKTEKMTVTVPKDLKKELKARALKEGRNFSNMVTVLLSKSVKEKAA
jgi:hypothetical protein